MDNYLAYYLDCACSFVIYNIQLPLIGMKIKQNKENIHIRPLDDTFPPKLSMNNVSFFKCLRFHLHRPAWVSLIFRRICLHKIFVVFCFVFHTFCFIFFFQSIVNSTKSSDTSSNSQRRINRWKSWIFSHIPW